MVACEPQERRAFDQPPPAAIFSRNVRNVVLEVDYAEGAEPFTGTVGSLPDIWAITKDNLEALVASSGKRISVPSTLEEMTKIDVPEGPYDSATILAIAEQNRRVAPSGDTISFYVEFLNDVYEQNGFIADTVLGAALGGTGVIALFKPVIEGAALPFEPNAAPFTEQATLVHEIGHSVGLVNVGLPMVENHEDPNHPSHCDNSGCVMYWANESATGVGQFLFGSVEAGNTVLFDSFCLADARAASRAADAGVSDTGVPEAGRVLEGGL